MINVLIVHHNTPNMMEHLLMSLDLHVPSYHAYIFDNSNKSPYTNPNKRSNITYFDNTQGQLINFEEEWKKYPARMPYIVSPYHCLSVEKCMELIDGNFILLDSDVLLKRDISELWDESQIFVGEIQETHPGHCQATASRALPFVCFINNKMCKANGIHYFDPGHMMQLYPETDPRGKLFDTGAAFYRLVKIFDLPYKEILHGDYVTHYGAASYRGSAGTVTLKHGGLGFTDWLAYHKDKYTARPKKDKTVVFCIADEKNPPLLTPGNVDPEYDYICFCHNPKFGPYGSWPSAVWEYRPIPEEVAKLSPKRQYSKIKSHIKELLPEYKEIQWLKTNRYVITTTTHSERVDFYCQLLENLKEIGIKYTIVLNYNLNEIKKSELDKIKETAQNLNLKFITNETDLPTVWKKIIPTLDLFPNHNVINIDDDRIYSKKMFTSLIHAFNGITPVSATHALNPYTRTLQHCGPLSISNQKIFLGRSGFKSAVEAVKSQPKELLNQASSDTFFNMWYWKSGNPIQSAGFDVEHITPKRDSVGWSDKHSTSIKDTYEFILANSLIFL